MSIFQRTSTTRLRQLGFTLLELVLVLFLIGLLASAGLLFTENIESQQQYEETVERYERIRKAIIQSGERTVNGRPELRGFAVDMGRLPYCLAELLYTGPISDVDYFESPCNAAGVFKMTRPGVTENGIRYGWHGPYIQVAPDSDGERHYRDGYGNDEPVFTGNSGWLWQLAESSTATPENIFSYTPPASGVPELFSLTIQSSGFDITDPNDNYPPDSELPELVSKNAWTVELGSMDVLFVNTSSVSDFAPSNPDQEWNITISRSGSPLPEFQSSPFSFTQAISSGATYQHDDVGINKTLPAGYYNFSIQCEDADGLPAGGECPGGDSDHTIIQLTPNHQSPTEFRWEFSP